MAQCRCESAPRCVPHLDDGVHQWLDLCELPHDHEVALEAASDQPVDYEAIDTSAMSLARAMRIHGLEFARDEAAEDLASHLAAAKRAQDVVEYFDAKLLAELA